MADSNLGNAIRTRRKAIGLTLQQLRLLTGISICHIGRIERGERLPSGPILRKLAEPLHFKETELLKIAGFLSRDDSDESIERLKIEIKRDIVEALTTLYKKVDNL